MNEDQYIKAALQTYLQVLLQTGNGHLISILEQTIQEQMK